jgi:hypothetical protein
MKVGFTGTREGMTQYQKEQFALKIYELGCTEFHHGDCKGADEDAHNIIRRIFPHIKIVVHPPKSTYLRAYCVGDETRKQYEYLVRDRNIVDETDYLIGTPLTDTPQFKSGTWYTIHYSESLKKPQFIIKRNGTTTI